ncbi:hypothetical protein BDZ91DRAFT_541480 [Kalaharituber pfeilii]|nr:hypothetical protein BDZ91DRAFT_541480 [Kalaharituber pfeilii]
MSLNHLRDDNTPGEATALDPVRSIRRRKRRLMEAILKMSSLQQLPKVEVQHPVIQGRTLPRSASCGNLDSPGPFLLKTGSRANIKSAASGTVLDIMDVVEQQTPQAEDRDLFSMLPDELNVRIFSFLRPKELVRASLVSSFF